MYKSFFKKILILGILIFLPSCEFLLYRMNNPRPVAQPMQNSLDQNVRGELQFIVIGDWGEKGNYSQKQVAYAMEKLESQEKIDFILTTGDNFYENGVSDLSDLHFKKSFEEIYLFSKSIPWYISLGNHDYMGDIQTLIEYGKVNPNWIFPSPYYSFEKKIEKENSVLFLMTDTSEFVNILGLLYYRSYMRKGESVIQMNWINSKLKNTNAKWKIVIGHHPIYSSGYHGDTKVLQKEFVETLEKNKVDLYFAGHDHDLQHLKHPEKRIHFFISGAGSKTRQITSNPYTIFAASQPGFAVVKINENKIEVRFINHNSKEIYKTLIEK